jgi:hypothetical protein
VIRFAAVLLAGAVVMALIGLSWVAEPVSVGAPLAEANGAPFWLLSREAIDARLAAWHDDLPDVASRVRANVLARLGTPYRNGCLGEAALPDTEPVFRLDESDCTVLVLTAAALAHARTLDEAESNMAVANYRAEGEARPIRYENRLHFTEDRLDASPYFRDVTSRVVPESLLAEVTLTLNEKSDGGRLLPIEWTRKMTLRYLPSTRATAGLLANVPPVCGVALVRKSTFPIGLAIAHEGVLLDGRSFVHASSESKEVVRVPFLEYLRKGEGFRFDGLVFYEFR